MNKILFFSTGRPDVKDRDRDGWSNPLELKHQNDLLMFDFLCRSVLSFLHSWAYFSPKCSQGQKGRSNTLGSPGGNIHTHSPFQKGELQGAEVLINRATVCISHLNEFLRNGSSDTQTGDRHTWMLTWRPQWNRRGSNYSACNHWLSVLSRDDPLGPVFLCRTPRRSYWSFTATNWVCSLSSSQRHNADKYLLSSCSSFGS